jgi:seryl-tRNA synthetase
MLDIKAIRENPHEFEKKLKSKDASIDIYLILAIDEKIRKSQTQVEKLKSRRNQLSKEIGELIAKKENISELIEEVKKINQNISELDNNLEQLNKSFQDKFDYLPNIPMDDVFVSKDTKDNICLFEYHEKKEFDFKPKNHLELNEKLKLFDFNRGAKLSGSGWPLYTDMGARLEWAFINYMLDTHRDNGFHQIIPPLLVNSKILKGSAHLPKFEEQLFKINDNDFQLYLIPTSEATLNGLHYDEILNDFDLPKQYVSYTPCFRRESGAAGEKERGLIRTHQFNKVELFCLTKPEDSEKFFNKMLQSAEKVLQGLELHYRNMLLVTADTSFASAKTIDVELWLPGQNRYYEVSSISNCTDFQARRSKIRYRNQNKKTTYVHTLNGSGVATSRLMVAFLENHQQEDGSIYIPAALEPYLGLSVIEPSSKVKSHAK